MNGKHFSPFSVFDPAHPARLPDHLQRMIESGVGTSRASYDKAAAYAKEHMKTIETIAQAAQSGSKAVGEKVLDHAETNTQAVFEAAASMARAKTFPDLARLQMEFVQQQLTAAHTQSQELFQLSAALAQETFATINSAVAKNFEQFKKIS